MIAAIENKESFLFMFLESYIYQKQYEKWPTKK